MRRASTAARLFALQLVGVVLLVVVAAGWQWHSVRTETERAAAARCTALATSVADAPFVVEALDDADPSAVLQPYALDLMRDTDTDFVTIMTPDRTRLTHPDADEIGRPFLGTIAPALAGEAFTETYAGTLGPSVRAVVPVVDDAGEVVALVAAGVTVDAVAAALQQRLPLLVGGALATVALGALASWWLSRYLRRVTRGRGPEELGRISDHHEAVLHSVREGLLLVDERGRLTLANDHAVELLGLDLDPAGLGRAPVPVADLDVPASLGLLLAEGRTVRDEVHVAREHVLVVDQRPATAPARPGRPDRAQGTVTTLRDRTEVVRLGDELRTLRTLSDALRAQTHEHANRLHTMVALVELGRGDEAVRFAAAELDLGQVLADRLVAGVDEPVLAALLLGKAAQARERDVELVLDVAPGSPEAGVDVRDLVTVVGNLVDNALDAVAPRVDADALAGPPVAPAAGAAAASGTSAVPGAERADVAAGGSALVRPGGPRPRVVVTLARPDAATLRVEVADDGPGLPAGTDVFARGTSTKAAGPEGRGLGLALVAQVARRRGGHASATSTPAGTVVRVDLPGGAP